MRGVLTALGYVYGMQPNVFFSSVGVIALWCDIEEHCILTNVACGVDSTVPTFNSCTNCLGSPGIIHDHTPDCRLVLYSTS